MSQRPEPRTIACRLLAGHRHFGLVVDDQDVVERLLIPKDAELVSGQAPDFRDLPGNYVQVVASEDVQFTKADHVLAGLGLSGLEKSETAIDGLAETGMGPEKDPSNPR